MRLRSRRRRRCPALGQTLVIFALMSLVLFGTVGLAVDAGFGYLSQEAADRAASAGALAGVPYMPDDFSHASASAVTVSTQNGFTDGQSHTTVVVQRWPDNCTPATCAPNRLTVVVKRTIPTTFISVLGFGSTSVTARETATYLRPLGLGQPGPVLGAGDNFPDKTAAGTTSYFMLDEEGWQVNRQNGDAFTPDPTSSASDVGNPYGNPVQQVAADQHQISGSREVPNLNLVPGVTLSGGAGGDRGGYNYFVRVPAGIHARIQVYSPIFAPDNGSGSCTAPEPAPCPNGTYVDDLGQTRNHSSNYDLNEGYFLPPNPAMRDFAATAYTILHINNVFDRTSDTPLTQKVVEPVDARGFNPPFRFVPPNGCASGMAAAEFAGATTSCFTPADLGDLYHQWSDVGAASAAPGPASLTRFAATGGPAPGFSSATETDYRLRIDTLGRSANSLKSYSVRVVDQLTGRPCGSCQVQAMNDMSIFVPLSAGSSSLQNVTPLVWVPPEYAGKQFTVTLFDPGDIAGARCIANCPVRPCSITRTCPPSPPSPCQIAHNCQPHCCVSDGQDRPMPLPNAPLGAVTAAPLRSNAPPPVYQSVHVSLLRPDANPLFTDGVPAQLAGTQASNPEALRNLGPSEWVDPATNQPQGTCITGCNIWANQDPADCASHGAPYANCADVQTVSRTNGQTLFNGEWISMTVRVPADYAQTVSPTDQSTWYWKMEYDLGSSTSTHDSMTVMVNFNGVPVHLETPGT